VIPLEIPPLRERGGDVALLAKSFVAEFAREFGKPIRRISPEALELLERYSWPGNVRELRNLLERSVLLSEGQELGADMLPQEVRRPRERSAPVVALGPEGLDIEELERDLLEAALKRAGGNRSEAGRLLGLSRHQIRTRLQKWGEE
jgi:DNA-binding NtrC family response regulator